MNIPLDWLEDFVALNVRVKVGDDIYDNTVKIVDGLTKEEIGGIVVDMIKKGKETLNDRV